MGLLLSIHLRASVSVLGELSFPAPPQLIVTFTSSDVSQVGGGGGGGGGAAGNEASSRHYGACCSWRERKSEGSLSSTSPQVVAAANGK